ncbi:serine/arginine repetitive matrix protein 1 isoform X3 [Anthonomus grandis grandis]|uniref:serine/arginine repetitive matrix protein 1 isoform X3 n=1 Tax=Anthonomus grandis grandis TaxID=2921223 RepID=UPI002165AFB0|nr:serine/arginine repetitive matrix protein 1 isoform X3 [Anthonomus grandis grandis]
MVVIVLVNDPSGQSLPNFPRKRVTYSSRIFIKPNLCYSQVEPGDTYATTKEEEWISKKKTEVLNTKQIETRVKRQVILEDGKVVEDSGPMVTTNTTEDTETQEHHQTEVRRLGDEDDTDGPRPLEDGTKGITEENWISVPNPDGVVREVKERRVISREETEEVKETEDVQHLGDITDEDFIAAVQSGKEDIRSVLRSTEGGRALVATGPRVIRDTSKTKKVTDTEDIKELSSVKPDGKIITETQRTTEHEEVDDDELPDDAPEQDYRKESAQRCLNTREQEEVDYLVNGKHVGHEMKYKTENMEIEKLGDEDPELFDSMSARARRNRTNGRHQPLRYRGISDWPERHPHQPHYVSSISQKPPTPYNQASSSPYQRGSSPIYQARPTSPLYQARPTSPYYGNERPVRSPSPDYRGRQHSPSPDYGRLPTRISPSPPVRDFNDSPTPPQRTKNADRREKFVDRRIRYDSGYRSTGKLDDSRDDRIERVEEPPPDYSPPSPLPISREEKKQYQKTRFAAETPTHKKSGNIIGQSIRKLVNKIRSASTERKAKQQQRAKRSPSPSYQPGHVIDGNIGHSTMDRQPVQRYYLGEDPFGGSIYGRENKYDGVKPTRNSRRPKDEDRTQRSQSTLGRFSKSTGRLGSDEKNSQTLPRPINKYEPPTRLNGNHRANSTINVSIINTVTPPPRVFNEAPAKPARTYQSNLSRSKSLIVHGDLDHSRNNSSNNMYTSTHRLNNEHSGGLKSPGLISSLNRSQKDITEDVYTSRFQRNVDSVDDGIRRPLYQDSNLGKTYEERTEYKRSYNNNLSNLKSRSPEFFRTINDDDDWRMKNYSSTLNKNSSSTNKFNGGDVYEPPTRLRDTHVSSASPSHSILRRGSTSSTDFSETYHTTSRNDDPLRPSITNTTKTVSKKTVPLKDGRGTETIESSETKSITKSSYSRGGNSPSVKFYEAGRPVVVEVRNSYSRK